MSSYCYICAAGEPTGIHVCSIVRPHTTAICVLILLYMRSRRTNRHICVQYRKASYYCYMCPHTAATYMPHTTAPYLQYRKASYCWYICIPHTAIHLASCEDASYCYIILASYCYMCAHTAIYLASSYYFRSSFRFRILLHMCPHTAMYASSHCYISSARILLHI